MIVLDVREDWEWDIAHLEGALPIPMNEVPNRLQELDPTKEIVVYCHTGRRSDTVANYLIREGFTQTVNMLGGIRAWTMEIDPELNPY